MKKIYISLILAVLTSVCMYGQNRLMPIPFGNVAEDLAITLRAQGSVNEEALRDSTITYNIDGTYSSKTVTAYGEYNGSKLYDISRYYWDEGTGSWVGTSRLVSANDSDGRIYQETYKWDAVSGGWVIDPIPSMNYKVEKEYNAQNLLELRAVYMWDFTFNKWSGTTKYTVGYDTLGREMKQEIFAWDSNNDNWLLNYTSYYSYEVTEDDKVKKRETLDVYVSGLEKRTKTEHGYDSIGNCVESINYSLNDSVWVGTSRQLYAYDSNNNRILYESYSYSETNGWVGTSRQLYAYDSNNNRILYESYSYSETNGWVGTSKYVYEYNENSRMTCSVYYWWDDSTGWVPDTKTTQDYNKFGLSSLLASYSWNTSSGKWEGSYAVENLVDNTGKLQGYLNYLWDTETDAWAYERKEMLIFDSQNNVMLGKNYLWVEKEWLLDSYTVYYPFSEEENQEIEAGEVKPVGDDNTGKFEIALTLPTETTVTGSLCIEFPEGISLDRENTAINPELASRFELAFTSLEGNKWKIDITDKQQGVRLALNEVTYKKILDVAYVVDSNAEAGEKIIEVTNISLDKSTGGTIRQDSLAVSVEVKKATGINHDAADNVAVYVSANQLVIRSSVNEAITIYTVSGTAVSSFVKQGSESRTDISMLPAGVYAVKSSAGWVAKVAKR